MGWDGTSLLAGQRKLCGTTAGRAGTGAFTLLGDHLLAHFTDQPSLDVFPEGDVKFFDKMDDDLLTFERDATGNTSAVVLHQNGRDIRAPRIQ